MGQLGDVVFENLKEPTNLNATKSFTYARHPVISGETKLQRTGEEPQSWNLTIRLHASFCNVEEEMDKLYSLANNLEDGEPSPVPFFLGEELVAEVVIESIQEQVKKTFPDGKILEAVLTLQLTEFV